LRDALVLAEMAPDRMTDTERVRCEELPDERMER
jgi:hypothetical protein